MFKSLRRMLVIYRPYRGKLIISQVFLFISAIASLASATLQQRLINQGIEAGNERVIIATSMWMVLLAVVAGLAMAGTAYYAVFFSQGTGYYVRNALYRKIQTFSFANFDQFRTGNLLVRLNADVQNVINAVLYTVMLLLYAPFMLVIAFILAFRDTPSLVWMLLVVAIVVLALMALIIPRVFKAYDDRQNQLDDVNNTMQENLTGIRVVKAFVRERLEIEKFGQRAAALRKPAFAAAFLVAFLNPLLQGIGQIARALAIWVGGEQVLSATLNIGELITFTQYLALVITPLALMAIVVPFVLRGETSAERLFEVYDAEPTVQDKPDAVPLPLEQVKGQVTFENVTFAFRRPDGQLDPPALKNINLTVEPGQRIGILGATGAGKSALVNLIPRFYDVQEGRITIDGIDVRDARQDDLRQVVGIALQEALLFQGKIRFNLKFGSPDADDAVMENGARAADAHGFITNLPEKWDAPVARRGYNFSGGQRQRLSMARTLTGQPRIVILDDSTSALDVATESRVQSNIPAFSQGATTIYVAQRISAVIDLDNIVLMQYGEIVDMGNHEELMQRSQLYQEIYESQLGAGMMSAREVA
ncbi:MAG: ABC transporter ATP-binding protein [Anaerolineae bacterium]|nr:ABC transporter ATP-binding protein [Anaerolineae bacterium]MCB0198976.1 ABC transporter ATP-binding protein [Anaerolineae bacterium]